LYFLSLRLFQQLNGFRTLFINNGIKFICINEQM
jgi:hypothetical protein